MERMPHIRLSKEDAAPYALLPGAPERIDSIANYLENVKELAYNREFRSIKGTYKGISIMATSTGIGGPSMAIAAEELSKLGVKGMIRIGSCGALQPEIQIGELILVNGSVREDGTSTSYIESGFPAIPDYELLRACEESACEHNFLHRVGMTRSYDRFYDEKREELCEHWRKCGVMGSDMETAALFVIGKIRGFRAASILNTVVNTSGSLTDGVNRYVNQDQLAMQGEQHEILTALEAFVRMNQK